MTRGCRQVHERQQVTHLCLLVSNRGLVGVLDAFGVVLVSAIDLVSNEKLVGADVGISIDFLEPWSNAFECVSVHYIEHNANAVGAAVVGRCDGSEALLAGGIPLNASKALELETA